VPDRNGTLVCRVEELPPGGSHIVDIGKFGVAVYNVKGELYALNNRCPHEGAQLGLGPVTGTVVSVGPHERSYCREGEIVRCPWHGWEFDIRTGETLWGSRKRAQAYPVWVEKGCVFVGDRPTSSGDEP
jgi:nitrite reductase (NADH) small subunit